MLDEFISLLEEGKEQVKKVLTPHVREKVLKYYIGGFFDDTGKKFIAYAFLPLKKSLYYEYNYLFDFSHGHTATYFLPETHEKTRKYINDNTFQHKETEELIDEGIYKSLLVSYTGEFDFNEWNILSSCCFCDIKDKNKLLNKELDRVKTTLKSHFFNSGLFKEASERYIESMKFAHSRSGRENQEIIIPTKLKPYIGHSTLVELVRSKKCAEVNRAFGDYIETAIFKFLKIKLKTFYPNKYFQFWGLMGMEFNILLPSHRQFCLMITLVTNKSKALSLKFYFYNLQENKIYEWIYFHIHPYDKNIKGYNMIVEVLKPISQLDHMDYFLHSECNFDDDNFWGNYVLRKENDQYVYLKDIIFPILTTQP